MSNGGIKNYLIAILRNGGNKILAKNINPNINKDDVKNILHSQGLSGEVKAVLLVSYDENGEPIKENFMSIRQGQATNQLTKMNARKRDNLTPDPFTGALKINNNNNFTVEIKNFPSSGELKNSTLQLLDALTLKITETGAKSTSINLSLHEYMNMRGLKDEKTAREQVKIDLEVFYNLSLHFMEKRRGKNTGNFIDVRLIDKKGVIKNSVIGVRLTPEFLELLKTYNIMPYPIRLLALNGNDNPNSYYFGRKIAEHKNMNYFKPNADIISVETLLNSSPVMPTFEDVTNTDRHYKSRIIEPFERDMNALEETFTWEYCHENGEPLTDKELEILYNDDKGTPSYNLFIKLLVKITWRYYPIRVEPPKKRKPKSLAPIAL